jgi:hypothetical protein
MEREEDEFWIVMAWDVPTTISFVHTSFYSAKVEAIRLAKLHNKKFIVMHSVYGVEVDNIVETKYTDGIPF